MKMLNDAIEVCEREYLVAKRHEDAEGMKKADARRSEHTKARDALLVFSEGLGKFVRAYEYVAQLVEFGDAQLEAFASYAKLLKKRLKGVSPEQVDLSGLTMTHYKIVDKGTITGGLKGGDEPTLTPIKGTGGRDPKDRLRAFLKELIAKLNDAFGKEITDQDKVAFAVHISEKLRGNETVMAQVMNNPLDQAMRADLPGATVTAIVDALGSHQSMATRLLSDEHTRKLFTEIVYAMLKSDAATDLLTEVRSDSNV
jgi:type I restriction enzyme R subunit